jgi:multidrug efflux pump
MERVLKTLPNGYGFEWTELTFQQKASANVAILVFPLCVLLVFLILSAQYESWSLPLAIILIVPMCLLSSMIGVKLSGSDNNILTQIGFIVLVGLACKNAILIVEFARERYDHGMGVIEAAVEACKLRLRPILMTSVATIAGAVPLVLAGGPGSASRAAIGVVVIFGVAFSTLLSLFVVPSFYSLLAPFTRSPDALARKIDSLDAETPAVGGHA